MNRQEEAIHRINNGENIFLTGAGGTGKSHVINQISNNSTLLCAPTGIAALNINGVTCHRAFGLPTEVVTKKHNTLHGRRNEPFVEMFSEDMIERIIIDEISMLRLDYFELINDKLQKIKKNDKPFGGVQVIVVGDFFQLEPIVASQRRFYYSLYNSAFCFMSDKWVFNTIELDKVYRQEKANQVSILNSVRKGDKFSGKALEAITKGAKPYYNSPSTLHLCTFNKDADAINKHWYNQLETREYTFKALVTGQWNEGDKPVPDHLKLRKGARVIMCANDVDGYYVNGDRGIVEEINHGKILVKLEDGRVISPNPFVWRRVSYTKKKGKLVRDDNNEYKQFPIKLAYAVSIHKSQGMTLTDVAIDTGERGCFSHGQLYVSLSRITDLNNLQLARPITKKDLIVKREVKDFYEKILHS